MIYRGLLPVFCLVTFWLGALPALADITVHIELRPRYNATPVLVPDPECPVNPDKIINIVLSPPKDANTTAPPSNFHLCGVDETVDSERLLAEWNGPYIFTFLNKKDTNVSYTTNVYSVVSSGEVMTTTTSTNITSPTSTTTTPTNILNSTTDKSNTSTTQMPTDTGTFTERNNTGPTTTTILNSTTDKSNPSTTAMPTDTGTLIGSNNNALYSLFICPPQYECNNAALEAAANGEEGFYPIFIGLSENFSAQQDIFEAEIDCLKSYYGGQKPNLCATKLVSGKLRGKSRMETMQNMFNFAFNQERKVSPNKIKQCNSSESTKATIQQCSFFDTTSDIWFARENQTVFESDGFVKAELLRNPTNKKAVCHVNTSVLESEDAATYDDFVHYDGPVVFEKNAQSAEVYVGLKVDNIFEEEEAFVMTIETLTQVRKKRSPMPSFSSSSSSGSSSNLNQAEAEAEAHKRHSQTTIIREREGNGLSSATCDDLGWETSVVIEEGGKYSFGDNVVKALVEGQAGINPETNLWSEGWNARKQGRNNDNPFIEGLTSVNLLYTNVHDQLTTLPLTGHHLIPWPIIGEGLSHLKQKIREAKPDEQQPMYNKVKDSLDNIFGSNKYKSVTWWRVLINMKTNLCSQGTTMSMSDVIEEVAYNINKMLRWTPSNVFIGPASSSRKGDPGENIDTPIYDILPDEMKKRFGFKMPTKTMPDFEYTPKKKWFTIIDLLARIDISAIPGPVWAKINAKKLKTIDNGQQLFDLPTRKNNKFICTADAWSNTNRDNCVTDTGTYPPHIHVEKGILFCAVGPGTNKEQSINTYSNCAVV